MSKDKDNITFLNNSIYEGEFKNKFNGQCKLIQSDNTILEGEFKDDKLNGQGKIIYSNGNIYEGDIFKVIAAAIVVNEYNPPFIV